MSEMTSITNSLVKTLPRSKLLKFQNDLFSKHRSKLIAAKVPRVEKIEVHYKGQNLADDALMLMNKNLSTPHQCAKHISNNMAQNSVLAFVKKCGLPEHDDGTIVSVKDASDDGDVSTEITVTEKLESQWLPWDLHRPFEYDCEVKLLGFQMNLPQPHEVLEVNKAYWKSCALLLGAVAQEAFEDYFLVKLAHLPNIPVESGAFCYDVELDSALMNKDNAKTWSPDKSTLVSLTKTARHIALQNLQFERLVVDKEFAQELFQHNDHQLKRIESDTFMSTKPDEVPLYRFGEYIDICDGPLIPNTSFLYHFVITAIHQLRCSGSDTCLWRLQGLSLPKPLQVHHAVWAMLEHRATRLVKKDLPFEILKSSLHDSEDPLYKYRSIENQTKNYNISTGQWLQDNWKSSMEKIKLKENTDCD